MINQDYCGNNSSSSVASISNYLLQADVTGVSCVRAHADMRVCGRMLCGCALYACDGRHRAYVRYKIVHLQVLHCTSGVTIILSCVYVAIQPIH